ncbi:unnamed protein product [Vitrella brassicaformis CCMP3155]|uniref:RING-type E3 ubiquitin transferase n=1 Tax=Vitrella brassicaformis (strain CCMP3155) TaxID=1169540 RepID=A0A0G4FWX5_VITBC|nr:unnamed protein product [Vitrella brassicaformis CCMP3155]|mmetsp:Transcript_6775/g.16453  ORF Transcript_6775/g.16453 Transcript_6775/m.16453 type:complete len:302 (-) Transcript_6775:336-1241(-)|eukprot:CEM19291.1 unnamed protein product [Vitrella brassicaformis CCMP3155]
MVSAGDFVPTASRDKTAAAGSSGSDRQGNTRKDTVSKTLELLECSVCCESMIPPIYQCKEGHTICQDCRLRVKQCPVCRSETLDIRCRALERLAESLDEINCKYSCYGCRVTVKYATKKDHEQKCAFRPFPCLHVCQGCSFEGSSNELVRHLVEEHGYTQHETHRISFICSKANVTVHPGSAGEEAEHYVWQKSIYSCYDKHFVLRIHRKVDVDPQFYISVAVLHSRHHSNRYSIATSGNHRKYTFEGPVWSIRKGFKEIERVRDCLILPENIALFLSGGKGSENDLGIINLNVTGEILPQ